MNSSIRVQIGKSAITHYKATDATGAPTTPAPTPVCTVTSPSATTTTPSVTTVETGHYRALVPCSAAGLWKIVWTSTAGTDTQYADCYA